MAFWPWKKIFLIIVIGNVTAILLMVAFLMIHNTFFAVMAIALDLGEAISVLMMVILPNIIPSNVQKRK